MAEEREKQCQLCGATYQPRKYAHRQKYCSVGCRERQRRIRKEAERKVVPERHCLACGKEFRVESEANRRKFCDKVCGKKYHNDHRDRTTPTDKQCVACGVTFHCGNNTGRRKYCNDDCREKHYRDQAKKQRTPAPARECVVCGEVIQAGRKRKYCSDQCAGRYYSGQSKWDGKLTPAQRQGKKCLYCAAKIVQSKRALKLYCSAKCARQFRYYTSPEERADIREQVREARPSKLSKKTFICKCCGKEFEGYERKKPVYCSQACSNASHSLAGSGRQVKTEEIRLPQSSAMHRAALELRACGKGASEIAAQLDCRLTTVQSWLRVYERRLSDPPKHRGYSEPYFRYIHARSAVEWRAVLIDEMRDTPGYLYNPAHETQETSVVLVSGTLNLVKSLYGLVAFVEYELGMDPTDGRSYVFCNPQRSRLKCFRWDGTGFQEARRQRDRGCYVWPLERHDTTVVVTPAEFEFILYGSQQKNRLEKR